MSEYLYGRPRGGMEGKRGLVMAQETRGKSVHDMPRMIQCEISGMLATYLSHFIHFGSDVTSET